MNNSLRNSLAALLLVSAANGAFAEQNKAEKAGVGLLPDAVDEKDTKKVIVPLARR